MPAASDDRKPAASEFDEYAGDYGAALDEGLKVSGEDKNFFAHGRVAHLAKVLKKLGAAADSVLDYGCGVGTATPFLLDVLGARKVVGIDVSEQSLQVARKEFGSPAATFETVAAHRPGADFDACYVNGVIHHVPLEHRAACFRHIFDALKPGGRLALWENNPWNPGTRYVMAHTPFDRDAITLSPPESRRRVREAGFVVERTDFLFYFPKMLRFLRFTEALGRKIPLGAQYLVLARKPV